MYVFAKLDFPMLRIKLFLQMNNFDKSLASILSMLQQSLQNLQYRLLKSFEAVGKLCCYGPQSLQNYSKSNKLFRNPAVPKLV